MIFNMRHWQRELKKMAARLRRHGKQRRWLPSSDPSVEKAVMLGFYSIRKTLHSFNPPPDLETPPALHLTAFPRNRSQRVPPADLFWPDVGEAFDLDKPSSCTLPLEYACNQFIHSVYFSLWLAPDRKLCGIFVCSDKEKEKRIFRFDLDQIINLFDTIAGSSRKIVPMKFAPETNRVTM